MSGFQVSKADGVAFTSFPVGEPGFVFVRDATSDGVQSSVVTVATLDWVREQFYDFLRDDRRECGVDYIEAYIMLEGVQGLQRCELGTAAGVKPGEGPRLMVSNAIGVFAMYDI